MIPGYQVLAARLRDELADLDRGVRRAERAWQAAQRAGSDQDADFLKGISRADDMAG